MSTAPTSEAATAAQAAFAGEQAALAASSVPDGVAPPGTVLEDVELLDASGAATTLFTALGERAGVLVLYRGAWCPYCNVALSTYQAHLLPELTARGVALLAISPQTPDGSLSTQEKNDLGFGVLSDPGSALGRRLGVLTTPSPQALAAQLSMGLDLTTANADGTATLPMPTTVVVDAGRVVRWIDVHPDYTTRTEPAAVLAALQREGL